jgi:ABC-type proline/glycine betaine transport system substrate-binding protein
MRALAMFLIFAVISADASGASGSYEGGCLYSAGLRKEKRVCNSEDPIDSTSCTRPSSAVLTHYPEIRIFNNNWESAMFMTWIAQIILSEAMMLPAVIETGSSSAKMNFYDPEMPFGYGEAYGTNTALKAGFEDPKCKNSYETNEKGCAHAQLETWSGNKPAFHKGESEGYVTYGGSNGMVGTLGWYISEWLLDQEPSLATFYGLRNNAKTSAFLKKPTTWKDYCEGNFEVGACTAACTTCRAQAPPGAGQNETYYLAGSYKGYFALTGIGHMTNAPCSWSTYVTSQIHYNGLSNSIQAGGPLVNGGYSYGQMNQIMRAGALLREGVLMWWWEPAFELESWVTEGNDFKFQRVILDRYSGECQSNRPLPDSEEGTCSPDINKRIGTKNGGCDYTAEALFKVFTSNLETHNGAAARMLYELQVTSEDTIKMLQTFKELGWSGENARKSVCDWMIANEGKWAPFVVTGFPKVTEVIAVSSGVSVLFAILGALGICFCVLMYVWLHKNSSNTVVERSQPLFLKLVLFGGVLMNIVVILVAQPPSDIVCTLQPWCGHIGFLMLLMPLLVKSWRVALFFNNKKLKNLSHINNAFLIKTLSIVGAGLVTYLIVWTAVAAPKPQVISTGIEDMGLHASSTVRETTICTSPEPVFALAAFVFEFLQLLWGVSLCVQLQGVPSEYSESTYIGLGIYNTTFFAIICGALIYAFDLGPDSETLLTGVSLFLASNIMLLLIFVPKMFRVQKVHSQVVDHTGMGTAMSQKVISTTAVTMSNPESPSSPSPGVSIADQKKPETRTPEKPQPIKEASVEGSDVP